MKLFISVLLVVFSLAAFSQPTTYTGKLSPRTNGQAIVIDAKVNIPNTLIIPRWQDTVQANIEIGRSVDSSGAMFYSYNTKTVWLRQHNPKKWVEIAGSGIASVPMWYNIKTNGADNTGVSDVSSLVNAAINAGFKDIYIPKGSYLLTSSIQLKDSVMIQGDGRGLSRIVVNTNIKAIVAGHVKGGYGSQIKDILILGNKSGGATSAQTGVYIDSVSKMLISNVFISNIGGAGVHIKRNGYCCGTYTQTATRGNIISNCYIENSGIGAFMDTTSEYNNIIGSTFHGNAIGVQISGGNNSMTGCNITYSNNKGLYLTGGSNNGHGIVSSCTINHNNRSVYIDGATLGVSMTGCNIHSEDSIVVKNSSNVNIVGGWFYATNVIYYDNNTYCTITGTNRLALTEPVITVGTGEAPTYIKAGKTNNALSWIDSKNSTEFSIGQTNGVVTFTGLGTAGVDTTSFKPLGINTSTKEVKPITYWPGGGGGGSGTVTSVATNTGSGITGGTITTTGTLSIDTAKIATRARVQKAVDSLGALLTLNSWLRSGNNYTTGTLSLGTSSSSAKLAIETNSVSSIDEHIRMEYSSGVVGAGAKISFTTLGGIEVGSIINERVGAGAYSTALRQWDGASNEEFFRVTSNGTAGSNSVGIGGSPAASAKLDVSSTTKGFLPPRMTTTQINAIASPANGLLVYNTTLNKLCVYENGTWKQVTTTNM